MWWAVRHQITLIANQNKKDFSGEEKRKKKKEYNDYVLEAKERHETLISREDSHDVDESEQEKIDGMFEEQYKKLVVEIIDNREVLSTSKPLVMENFIKTFDTNY